MDVDPEISSKTRRLVIPNIFSEKSRNFQNNKPMPASIGSFVRQSITHNSLQSLNNPHLPHGFNPSLNPLLIRQSINFQETPRKSFGQEDISRQFRDLHSELENARQALNKVEAQISQTPVSHRKTITRPLIVGQHGISSPYMQGLGEPAASFSQRVLAFSQRQKTDRISQEERQMKDLIGRIQSELADTK